MTPKEIYTALCIDGNRIKYFKRCGLFVPENPPVGNRATVYTQNDFNRLKVLVNLTSLGLTCGDIRDIEEGIKSPVEVIQARLISLKREIALKKSITNSLNKLLKEYDTQEY